MFDKWRMLTVIGKLNCKYLVPKDASPDEIYEKNFELMGDLLDKYQKRAK